MSNFQGELIFNEEITPKAGVKIPFGIHINCDVVSVVRGTTENNKNYIDINFQDSEGRSNNKRLWEPQGNYPRKDKDGKITETQEQALEREQRQNLAHLTKLVHIFLGKDGVKQLAGNYDEFANQAIKALAPKLSTKKVNLKLVYDSDGVYAEFGRIPDYVEEYVEGQEPNIHFTTWELANRCTPKPVITPTPSPSYSDLL